MAEYADDASYTEAVRAYPPCPIPREDTRVPQGQKCPTCSIVCHPLLLGSVYAPGCFIAGDGRRWDCFETWGRVLNDEEKALMEEWAADFPRLVRPDDS